MEFQSHTKKRPRAVFIAFGTKGDVLPVAYLSLHMAAADVSFCAISTAPVLVLQTNNEEVQTGTQSVSPYFRKQALEHQHRKECFAAMENIFGKDSVQGDFIAINFFALEGWHLAELFQVPCVVAAPYVVPYSSPSSFERRFKIAHPLLYEQLQEDSPNKVCWRDVMHWMWPLFTERWSSWREDCLHISPCPLTDPVTGLPISHHWPKSPLLLYGFSKEVVECPGYWPPNVYVCGFWFPPAEWELPKQKGSENSVEEPAEGESMKPMKLCLNPSIIPVRLRHFLAESSNNSCKPIFIGLSSIGSMGYIENPEGMLLSLRKILEETSYRVIFLTAGHPPLDTAIKYFAGEFQGTCKLPDSCARDCQGISETGEDGQLLLNNRLLCYAGSIPYSWLFPKCSVIIHHGGSGSTAAALSAGLPQIICPFTMDQFYWAERMGWLGVAPPPLKKKHLIPDNHKDSIMEAANALLDALNTALSVGMRTRAADLAGKICSEDGVRNAIDILTKEVCVSMDLCCED
ncbi:sterol 3-beta-glucosyltransferase UGT80A2 isoform X4 [Cryptomeria japonica]|uniref:sterol 3-beta-glucosyltransferase UGT80A2 isoform X4 n=1 Tax=Cryptomeria japonica TaxID=3369 RepID=UPI0025AD87F8|nr:sterol 3-beta-glucosyltransferase UGT80A2 isoform X4 [Cryptomeria japonica]